MSADEAAVAKVVSQALDKVIADIRELRPAGREPDPRRKRGNPLLRQDDVIRLIRAAKPEIP